MQYSYTPHGVCSRAILIDAEDGVVNKVQFIGGCSGNTQGIAALVEGMPIDEVVKRLENIKCGSRPTSCPDQLAKALKKVAFCTFYFKFRSSILSIKNSIACL